MHDVGIGDVIFIILILGVIHGIMHLVTYFRGQKASPDDQNEDSQAQ